MSVIAGQSLVEQKTATKEQIRQFVKDMAEIGQQIKDAKSDLKETVGGLPEIITLNEQIKKLKEERKEIVETSEVARTYQEKLDELVDEKEEIIFHAKNNGVPKNEIELAEKALRSDIDIELVKDVYSQIADLVD